MDDFIKDNAHELNTPITILRMSVGRVRSQFPENRPLQYISIAEKQIEEIYESLNYLSFEQLDEAHDEPIRIDGVVHESHLFFKEIAEHKDVKLTSSLNPTMVIMDRRRAIRLVHNLISNAIKYTPKGGWVKLSLHEGVLEIADSGIGIPESKQKHVFKRYVRATHREGGFGVGLSIVQKIVESYGLGLEMDSKEGQGTTITIALQPILTSNA